MGRMLLVLTVFMVIIVKQDVLAAKVLRFDNNPQSNRGFKHTTSSSQLSRQLRLEKGTEIKLVRCTENVMGNKVCKYEETFRGRKIFDASMLIEHQEDLNRNVVLGGDFFADIEADLESQAGCSVSDQKCAEIISSHFNLPKDYKVESVNPNIIFINEKGQARLAKEVDLHASIKHDLQRKMGLVDVCTGDLLLAVNRSGTFFDRDGHVSAKSAFAEDITVNNCPTCGYLPKYPDNVNLPGTLCDVRHKGGNPNQELEFGIPPICLHPMRRSANLSYCYMENEYVRVVDLLEYYDYFKTNVASFPCDQRYNDETNGGYAPSADAFFFATKVSQMYEYWYDDKVLRNPPVYTKVRFGYLYNNAIYAGDLGVLLGSGDGYFFYPFNGLNIVGHEMAHGVTQHSSDLIYQYQSGGINEAYSDMAGEAAEEFVFGQVDFLVAADLVVNPYFILRYFEDPTKDGISIKHVDDYYDGLDVHYSSGVYNRVFWLMAQHLGVRDAFECFARANRVYWTPTTTFESGACDTLKATYDAGFDVDVVADSFRDVGITFSECPHFEYFVTGTLMENHIKSNIVVTDKKQPLFKVTIPYYAKKMTIIVTGGVHIFISTSYKRSEPVLAKGYGQATISLVRSMRLCSTLYVRLQRDSETLVDRNPVSASAQFK